METTLVYWGHIGRMERNMETTTVYWGYIGRMEKKTEITVVYKGENKPRFRNVPKRVRLHVTEPILGSMGCSQIHEHVVSAGMGTLFGVYKHPPVYGNVRRDEKKRD